MKTLTRAKRLAAPFQWATGRQFLGISLAGVALSLLSGCGSGMTKYAPQLRAQGELTLKYDDGFSMHAEGREIASGVAWGGLTEYVKCVPKAKEHAESAQANGAGALVLSWTGAGIGLGSLGTLGALSIYDKDPDLAGAILGIGAAAAITGVVLAAIGRNQKNVANGNAVDAMNYYNDEVGSYGGTCRNPAPPLPSVEVAPTAPAAPKEKPKTAPASNERVPTEEPGQTPTSVPRAPSNPDEI